MENLDLLKVIYDLRESQAKDCITIGLDESVKFAAEMRYLESLNFLLSMHKDPGKIVKDCILTKEDLLEDLLHKSAEKDCHDIFKWILAEVDVKKLTENFEGNYRTTFFHRYVLVGYLPLKNMTSLLCKYFFGSVPDQKLLPQVVCNFTKFLR